MIERSVERATRAEHDVLVIGGGVYGAALLLEAARRGLRACLCEAEDFGGGTSGNSLRIVHGGLRYLQSANLQRFFESVAARRGFARDFPDLVRPLSCLMPLYGQGLSRPALLRLALAANDALSGARNRGVRADRRIPRGSVLGADAVRRRFPRVRRDGLQGAARWSDYFMVSSERVIVEMLHWACSLGATALNQARVEKLRVDGGRAVGALVRDAVSGRTLQIGARAVVCCAGPATAAFAGAATGERGEWFRASLAFNVLLDAELEAQDALAVAAPARGSPVLFLLPQPGSVLAGTRHVPRPPDAVQAVPSETELEEFLALIRAAVPGLDVRLGNVRRVFAGLLPVRSPRSVDLSAREVVIDHGRARGPRGFYSVSGVKFTTARRVATRVLDALSRSADVRSADVRAGAADESAAAWPLSAATPLLTDALRLWSDPEESTCAALLRTVREESVGSLDDLVLRRSNWSTTETDLDAVRRRVADLLSAEQPNLRWTGT